MTNTRITDPEILEERFPVILRQFSLRKNTGGKGDFIGGDGVIREIEFCKQLTLSILSERRGKYAPYGLNGGGNGAVGVNTLITANGDKIKLEGKVQRKVNLGDRILLETPSGGGVNKKKL